jgi:hypothetical protein
VNLGAYSVLSVIPRTRKNGMIGLIGAALLLTAAIFVEFCHDFFSLALLEISGATLLFISALVSVKRRYV